MARVICLTLLLLSIAFRFDCGTARAVGPSAIRALMLGDNGHHKPANLAAKLVPALAAKGIDVTYTQQVADLNPQTLAKYDCLILYANHGTMSAEQEQALLDYVDAGHGFVPLHCASACFGNRPKFIALVGGRFKRHATGVFSAKVVQPGHPAVRGFEAFEAWDETYEHDQLSDDREVLMVRVEGQLQEPWTWVRRQGQGRVFYTASGHDDRCWRNPGFLNLVERGIRWSTGGDPAVAGTAAQGNVAADPAATNLAGKRLTSNDSFPVPAMTGPSQDAKPFAYVPAKIAFYPPGGARVGDGEWNQMQLPLSPPDSQRHIRVPEGFSAELFAAEPQIGKPLCLAWDVRGRLWLAETVDYPNEIQPSGTGRDRIRICEDTDGDGRADKFIVFADKLSIPTSLTFARGGVIVQQAPQTLFLQDVDGDDVADERRVLFEGWSTRDTHAGPSNLQYGLDNWIWGMVGYSGFDGDVGGEHFKFNQGFYRFKADASKFEFLRSSNNNTWGLGFSEEGLVFGSTANRNPSMYLPIANRYYESVRGWSAGVLGTIADSHLFHAATEKVRQVDHHGGYTAAAGHAIYTARTYPQPYWNRTAFVAEPTGHLVGTFVLNRDGSDVHSTNPFNLLGSDDEWCAPIMAEVGPDGHVWVIDWYNYIVQHNPTPAGFKTGKGGAYESDLRDKQHGRIYRIVYRSAPNIVPLDLRGATPDQLVATLKHTNMLWRKHAQRLLVERGKTDVTAALVAIVNEKTRDAIGLNVGAIHALWTLHGLGALNGAEPQVTVATEATKSAIGALNHPSAGVRRNAVQVLPRTREAAAAVIKAGGLFDADAQVRLATLLALAEMPPDAAVAKAVAGMALRPENAGDKWIPDAITTAGAAHDVYFLKTLAADWAKPNALPAQSARLLEIATTVAQHYARGQSAPSIGGLLVSLADAQPHVAEAVVQGLAKGWPKGQPAQLSAAAESSSVALFEKLSPAGRGQLVNLHSRLGSQGLEQYSAEIVAALLTRAANEKISDADRLAAVQQAVQFPGSDAATLDQLLTLITPRLSPELTAGLIDSLAASDSATLAPALVDRMPGLAPAGRNAVMRVLLGRGDRTAALLHACESRKLLLSELTLDQKQALAAHPDKKLAERAKKLLASGGALPDANRQLVLDKLLPLTRQTGDVERGKQVFVKQCSKCHMHGGIGNKIGPDLTGMAVHPKAELLTNIIDPSRGVEGNYRVYNVITEDGRVLNGLLTSETKTSIELVDAEGKRFAIQRDDAAQLVASPKSIMPEGFEKQAGESEITDLLEFLTARGKYLTVPLDKAVTAVTTKGMFHPGDNGPDRLIFDDWGAKTFHGVPFQLIDPRGDKLPNAILLYGPQGTLPPSMPKSVRVACNAPTKAIHLLSGVGGWSFPASPKGSVSLIVRLHYTDGQSEDHLLRNGEQFADYIRHVDVPGSEFAFALRGQQLRYLAVQPQRPMPIREIEFLKGPDNTAPIIMAVTVESP